MAKGEVLVSSGEISESGEDILDELPPWMPRSESTGNFKLLDAVGRGFDRLKEDIETANKATNPQTAESIGQLKQLGKIVETKPKTEESVNKYRRRLVGEFQITTNEATLEDIFKNISTLLDIQVESIGYNQGTESNSIILSVPANSIDSISLTQEEFAEILNKQVAAGFNIDLQSRGTFTYRTVGSYENEVNNTDKGYDGLDSNNNPKNNGGTYAGLLR